MATVQHPAFDNVTQTVDNPDEWVEQGWLLVANDDTSGEDTDTNK